MAARTKARKRAVDVLFEADQRGIDPVTVLADRLKQADPPVNEYTVTLVEGVLARSLSTDESPQFVNGLLARLMSLKPTLSI